MKTRYTVSPKGNGYAVLDNGLFLSQWPTWGQAKKEANRLNDGLRTVRMKYQPQLAKPSGHTGPDWIQERKWDGMRAIFELGEDDTLIFSRTGQDLRPQYPELCDLHEVIGVPCILDGEIIALAEPDVENLELLQDRSGDKQARRMTEIPVEVRFFDVLEVQGTDIRSRPLVERRDMLRHVLEGTQYGVPETLEPGAEVPSHWEGTVSKDPKSPYESGKRRASWVKFKWVERATLRVSTNGLTPGKGARSSVFGAVVVEDEDGVPRGQVGSGFPKSIIDEILSRRDAGTLWGSLVEVEYRFLSKTGLMVNTAFKGFRDDKKEADRLG